MNMNFGFVIAQVQTIKDNINRLLGRVKVTDGTNDAGIIGTPVDALRAAIVDSSGNQINSFTGGTTTANQGTANTAANRWPVYPTDGTNNMPTMDAAERAGFQRITNGTNSPNIIAHNSNIINGTYLLQTAAGIYGWDAALNRWNAIGTDGVTNMNLNVRVRSGANGLYVTPDGAIVAYDETVNSVHSGTSFFIKGYASLTGAGATLDFLFSIPSGTKFVHPYWTYMVESEYTMDIYEGVTTSSDGTPITTYNRNRNSATTSVVTAFSTPTITAAGTLIWSSRVGSGGGIGGSSESHSGFIMKQNTKYVFRFTHVPSGTDYVDFNFGWNELLF